MLAVIFRAAARQISLLTNRIVRGGGDAVLSATAAPPAADTGIGLTLAAIGRFMTTSVMTRMTVITADAQLGQMMASTLMSAALMILMTPPVVLGRSIMLLMMALMPVVLDRSIMLMMMALMPMRPPL